MAQIFEELMRGIAAGGMSELARPLGIAKSTICRFCHC